MPSKTRTFYGFRHSETGELARLEADYDGPYRLTRCEEFPVFEADSPEALANVLFDDTPGYNSRPDQPGWGDFRQGELVPVRVTTVVDTQDLELPEVARVSTLEVRSIPSVLARRYAGHAFEARAGKPGLVFWLVELPEGESLETVARKWVGGTVYGGDRYSKRHLYAAAPVPEEYVPLTENKRPCALFIASDAFY